MIAPDYRARRIAASARAEAQEPGTAEISAVQAIAAAQGQEQEQEPGTVAATSAARAIAAEEHSTPAAGLKPATLPVEGTRAWVIAAAEAMAAEALRVAVAVEERAVVAVVVDAAVVVAVVVAVDGAKRRSMR